MHKVLISMVGGLIAGSAIAQQVMPVKPVPRFGPGAPGLTERDVRGVKPHRTRPPSYRLGRAGPPGSALPSGQVGPYCMTPLWRAGFHANSVNCPVYLPARPGAQEQCVAHDAAGRTRMITVTFLDWNPSNATGTVDCGVPQASVTLRFDADMVAIKREMSARQTDLVLLAIPPNRTTNSNAPDRIQLGAIRFFGYDQARDWIRSMKTFLAAAFAPTAAPRQ